MKRESENKNIENNKQKWINSRLKVKNEDFIIICKKTEEIKEKEKPKEEEAKKQPLEIIKED